MTPITQSPRSASTPYHVEQYRRDFPILSQQVHGHPLVYLDNAATTQKPQVVLRAIQHYYEQDNANVHRGVHELSVRATAAYEQARLKVQRFLNAGRSEEIIFVRGATEGVNLVAQSYGRSQLYDGDEVLITHMEHHSNIVPWQMVCEQTGAHLRVVPINDRGELLMDEYHRLLTPRTRIVAVTHISNALGTINPLREMIPAAHAVGAVVLVDGAQAAPHLPIDVRELQCDFYVLSGHKMYGPSGVGVLYGRSDLLRAMPPYQGGGEMIRTVTLEHTTYNDPPHRFEAGTPHISGAVALASAIDYLQDIGLEHIAAYEQALLEYATAALAELPGLRFIGTASDKAAVLSWHFDDIHPHDIGTFLDHEGIAVRTGHHCAQPVMDRYNIPATVRASFGLYNTRDEVDCLVHGLQKVIKVFR
ncbi:MAG: Cysteine desulfurase [Phycisphaerae bacterium]|nr:Cysteine desulfurase [Phycisphaerae bacterium]